MNVPQIYFELKKKKKKFQKKSLLYNSFLSEEINK